MERCACAGGSCRPDHDEDIILLVGALVAMPISKELIGVIEKLNMTSRVRLVPDSRRYGGCLMLADVVACRH